MSWPKNAPARSPVPARINILPLKVNTSWMSRPQNAKSWAGQFPSMTEPSDTSSRPREPPTARSPCVASFLDERERTEARSVYSCAQTFRGMASTSPRGRYEDSSAADTVELEIWAPRLPCARGGISRMAPRSRGHNGECALLRDLGATHCTGSAPMPECGAQIFSVASIRSPDG